jgi:hypothetical protein
MTMEEQKITLTHLNIRQSIVILLAKLIALDIVLTSLVIGIRWFTMECLILSNQNSDDECTPKCISPTSHSLDGSKFNLFIIFYYNQYDRFLKNYHKGLMLFLLKQPVELFNSFNIVS